MNCTLCPNGDALPRRRHAERVLCDACDALPPIVDWQNPPPRVDLPYTEAGRLRTVVASTVKVEQVEFLVEGRVALGAVTLLVGDPGLGKSTWSTLLAAEVTRGKHGPAATVLMANAEDSPAHVTVPRLMASEADLDRIEFFDVATSDGGRPFTLPTDVAALEDHARSCGARLVVIDPFAAFLADDVRSHSDHSVRRALAPLAAMAERRSIAIVIVAHLNKAQGTDPIYRVGGSIGITGAARSLLLFGRDPDDPDEDTGARRVLAHAKSNWGELAPTLVYEHVPATISARNLTVDTHRLQLIGESEVAGRSLLAADRDDPPASKAERAEEILADQLDDSEWHRAGEIIEIAKQRGISRPTLDRVAREVGVEREKRGMPGVIYWRLPLTAHATSRPVSSQGLSSQGIPLYSVDSNTRDPLTAHPSMGEQSDDLQDRAEDLHRRFFEMEPT